MEREYRRTHAEVNVSDIEWNLRQGREQLHEGCLVMAVLKGDAYGHGIEKTVVACEQVTDWYGVATLEEAVRIRNTGSEKPILIFGFVEMEDVEQVTDLRLTLSAPSVSYAEQLNLEAGKLGRKLEIHIKADTGMNRTGIRCRDMEGAVKEAEVILQCEYLQVTGIYTHFACPESKRETDERFTEEQFRKFVEFCGCLEQKGYSLGLKHSASSAAGLLHPETQLDLVRFGMLTYGQGCSEDYVKQYRLRPALTWVSRIVQMGTVEAGESISYGRTFVAERHMRIAVVSVGFGDGYQRQCSNKTEVLICGKRAKVLGKVCMDYLIADVSDIPEAAVGTEVVLLGRDGEEWISANELSEKIENVSGGITCQILPRVPRIYVRNEK